MTTAIVAATATVAATTVTATGMEMGMGIANLMETEGTTCGQRRSTTQACRAGANGKCKGKGKGTAKAKGKGKGKNHGNASRKHTQHLLKTWGMHDVS